MPGLDDIRPGGISQLAPAAQQGMNALQTAGLDGRIIGAANTLSALPKLDSPQTAYRFVMQQFGLERLPINLYRRGEELDNTTGGVGSGYSFTDKGETTMHTGKSGKPPLSILGTPIFCDLILSATKKTVTNYQDETTTETVQMLQVLVDVHMTKNIVKTTVQGVDGTVKEYISLGDYMVTIRGVFTNTFKKDYPKKQVQQLTRLFERRQSLEVVSEYLSLFRITNLVVEDFSMGQEAGKQNTQKFEAICSSDKPLILRKK